MNIYLLLLSLHIIFIVTWFAALFYIVRLFIYHSEALEKPEPEKSILAKQFIIMEKRLMNIIGIPSMVLSIGLGISLLSMRPEYLSQGWMQMKLAFVFLVILYHFICLRNMNKLASGKTTWNSSQFRLFNEAATLLLVAIVFLVVMKNTMDMITGAAILVCIGLALFLAIRLYKKYRDRNE